MALVNQVTRANRGRKIGERPGRRKYGVTGRMKAAWPKKEVGRAGKKPGTGGGGGGRGAAAAAAAAAAAFIRAGAREVKARRSALLPSRARFLARRKGTGSQLLRSNNTNTGTNANTNTNNNNNNNNNNKGEFSSPLLLFF